MTSAHFFSQVALAFFIIVLEVYMEFLTSIGIILICGLVLGSICSKLRLPPLLGMLVVGIVIGPYVLNLIAPSVLAISSDLRQLALIIVLTRAGLSLNFNELKKNGRSAVLMCFLPAIMEMIGYVIFGILILKMRWDESALLGCVMAAVSPAVIVPRMLKLKENGYGVAKGIPQMILTGASADDVFVIILFTAFVGMAGGGSFDFNIIWRIPISIALGIGLGLGVGRVLAQAVKRFHIRDTVKMIVTLCFSFFFVSLENHISSVVPFSGLLAVISMSAMLFASHEECAKRLSIRYNKLWIVAEILLFVLVGATVDLSFAVRSCALIIVVVVLALLFRMIGVYLCVIGSRLNAKEKLFCAIAYTPKATVQAAIGAIPLSMGLACGQIVLTAAVIAIVITAPVGAFLIDSLHKKLLSKDEANDTIDQKN